MQKHTPGPWEAMPESWKEHHVDISAKDWGALAIVVVNVDGQPSEAGEANAKLIAAAPELLAACQAQHKAIDYLMARLIEANTGFMPTESKVWPTILSANAAILKATGGAQ